MKIERLKLYHYYATRSARVKWLMHELLGDDFDVEVVDLYGGDQYSSDYQAMNPNHNVPSLEITFTDGSMKLMLESAAMLEFLADQYPEKQLAPAVEDAAARADYLQMMHFGGTWVDMMLWQIRTQTDLLSDDERDQPTIERYENKFKSEIEPQILERVGDDAFICGDTFCAADCLMGHNVMWARGYGLCQDDAFKAYFKRLAARPAFQQAFADAHRFERVPPDDAPIRKRFSG